MIVYMTHSGERNDMEITITGIDAHTLFDATILWDLTPVDDSMAANTGMIAMSNTENTWGRVCSRGLYVDTCNTLQQLRIAIDLSKQQPRDRHLLPPQLMERVADILKELHQKRGTQAVEAIFEHMRSRLYHNMHDHYIRQAAMALEDVMRKYYAKVHNCTKDKIQFIAGHCDKQTRHTLTKFGYVPIEHSGPLAYDFDLNILKQKVFSNCKAFKSDDNFDKQSLLAIKRFIKALQSIFSFKVKIIETEADGQCLAENEKGIIYLSGNLATADNVVTGAIMVNAKLMEWLDLMNRSDDKLEAGATLQQFMSNPIMFGKKVRKRKSDIYEGESDPDEIISDDDSSSDESDNGNADIDDDDSDADDNNNYAAANTTSRVSTYDSTINTHVESSEASGHHIGIISNGNTANEMDVEADANDNNNDDNTNATAAIPIMAAPPMKKKRTAADISAAIQSIPKLLTVQPNTTALQQCAYTAVPTLLTADNSISTSVQYKPKKLVHMHVSSQDNSVQHGVYVSKELHGNVMKACFEKQITYTAVTNISDA
jgi:hypothetical protein